MDQPEPDGRSFDPPPVQGGGLHQELLLSHLSVAAIGFAILILMLAIYLWLRTHTLRLANVRGPTSSASAQALGGLERSLAALRGWIVLGDSSFRNERKMAWNQQILPQIASLQALSQGWTDAEQKARLAELAASLEDLKEIQWWIEDVAQTPGNEPARFDFSARVEPVANAVLSLTSSLIDLESLSPAGDGRKTLLALLAHFHGRFSSSRRALESFLSTGESADEQDFRDSLKLAQQRMTEIHSLRHLATAAQAELLVPMQDEFLAYQALANEVIETRKSDQWNIAQNLLTTEALELARRSSEILRTMATAQYRLTRGDAALVTRISDMVIGVSLFLIAGLVLVTWLASHRRAKHITEPIIALSRAAYALAAGRSTAELTVESKDELGHLTAAFNTMRGSLQKSEAALQQERHLLRSLLDYTPDSIYFKDTSSRFIRISRALARRFGLDDPKEALERSDSDFFSEEHARQALADETALLSGRVDVVSKEEKETWRDGTINWVSTSKVPLQSEDGEVIGTFGISRDITEQKLAAEALEKSEATLKLRNTEMEQFVYTVSHDLKSPLVTCEGFIGLLKEDLANGRMEEVLDSVQRIEGASQHMGQLIQDLLQLSRIGRVRSEPVQIDMAAMMEELSAEFRERLEQCGATLEIEADMPSVVADPSAFYRVFENLVNNSLKYACENPGGIIAIGSDATEKETRFFVRDNGPGIPKEYQDKIFGLFQRLDKKKEGTGIGLAIVAKIMLVHQGRVWVESNSGEGATFWVALPTQNE